MNNLTSIAVVVLIGFLSAAVVGVIGFLSWLFVRRRQMELTAFDTDEQAARMLGEAFGQCRVSAGVVEEVMAAFAMMDSATKRMLAMTIAGLIAQTSADDYHDIGPRIQGIVRGLQAQREPDQATVPVEQPGSEAFFDPGRTKSG